MKKKKISSYRLGVQDSNRDITSLKKFGMSKKKLRAACDRKHDKNDSNMYWAKTQKNNSLFDYYRGLATGYGMYAHTGKRLR